MNKMFKRHSDLSPYLITGPCSAESFEQLYATANQLQQHVNFDLFRAGIWKPRTRPNSFEGFGEEALKWLRDVKQELNIHTCIEVANSKHVDLALKYGVDVLWIGARTSVNPFSVQDIADALQGTHVPVMIKNPINPDLQLWIGALERIQQSTDADVAVIHRGFSSYGSSLYRNEPMWHIPIDFKRLFPNVPILCDPSHIGGKRDSIYSIAQEAMDLMFDGLMIESHNNPDKALSDAKQQVTPKRLQNILERLILRNPDDISGSVLLKLSELRSHIDSIDETILRDIVTRLELIEKIGVLKKQHNIPILQVERWASILERLTTLGKKLELSEKFLNEFLNSLHTESIRKQIDILNDKKV